MTDREKVIKALELCTSKIETRTQIPCETCSYHNRKYHGVHGDGCCNARSLQRDALALLKAQEQKPRVMTLDEIKALPDYVFLEDRDISHAFSIKIISRPALPQLVFVNISGKECVGFRGPDGDTSLVTSRYGVEWRCWTSRPTDEQREAVKWHV